MSFYILVIFKPTLHKKMKATKNTCSCFFHCRYGNCRTERRLDVHPSRSAPHGAHTASDWSECTQTHFPASVRLTRSQSPAREGGTVGQNKYRLGSQKALDEAVGKKIPSNIFQV